MADRAVLGWRDVFTLAGRGVSRRAGRAVLTVLAVALAATLLVGLLTVAGTAQTRVLSQLAKGGPLTGIRVAAAAPDITQVDEDNAKPGAARDLDDAALQRIRALPLARTVVPLRGSSVFVSSTRPAAAVLPSDIKTVPAELQRGGATDFSDTELGVDPAEMGQLPITLLAGRLPARGSSGEVALTPGFLHRIAVDRTSSASVVGMEITVAAPQATFLDGRLQPRGRWRRLLVVGVVAQEAGTGELLSPAAEVESDREWTLGGAPLRGIPQPTSDYTGLVVVARSLDDVGVLRAQITEVGYSTQAPENLVATVQRYLHVVEIVLSGIGVIALVIASLGIANALLAAVRERRREIGVLKAIGARDVDILRIFLVEAAVLGLLGGIAGTLAGWGVAVAVARVVSGYLTSQGLVGVAADLSGVVAVGGVLGSVLLALVAGVAPALRAARLPAREAVGSA